MSKRQIDANLFYRNSVATIRSILWGRDRGICAKCKKKCVWDEWEADHIKEVRFGGDPCPIENFQTLCLKCHGKKSGESTAGTSEPKLRQQMHIPVSAELHQRLRMLAAKHNKTLNALCTRALLEGWRQLKDREEL